jgi:hypothetical protein
MDNIFSEWETSTADTQRTTIIQFQRYLEMKQREVELAISEVELAISRWEYEQEQDFVEEMA